MKRAGRRKFRPLEGDETLVNFGGGTLLNEFIHRLGQALRMSIGDTHDPGGHPGPEPPDGLYPFGSKPASRPPSGLPLLIIN